MLARIKANKEQAARVAVEERLLQELLAEANNMVLYCEECDKALNGERPTKLTKQLLRLIATSFKFQV